MMKRQEDPRRQVSVEDLLRIKKAERPNREFWGDWQGRVRSRVSEAAARKRPWWKDALPRLGITVARWHVALGATALATLVIVALEEYQPALPSLPVAAAAVPAGEVLGVASIPSSLPTRTAIRVSSDVSENTTVELPAAETRSFAPGQLSSAVAMILTPERGAQPIVSDSHLNLGLQTKIGQQDSLAEPMSLETMRAGANTVAAAKPATESHRTHFLHYAYNPTARLDAADSTRVAGFDSTRLSEDELYETASSRLGARGDRLSLRF